MIKKLLKIVSALLVIALICAGIFFYSIFISVERLTVDYHTLSSPKIPVELHDIKVAFISDLEYNHFMDKERLTKMVATINEAKPDIVLFGGDIFDLPLTYVPNDATKQEVSQLLKEIDAPLGKFAVLGEQDNVDEEVRTMVQDVLLASDFELLNNTSIQIRNGSDAAITLIGVDSLINGTVDMEAAFSDVDSQQFHILLAHCPDTYKLDEFPLTDIDLMFAGHSHAAQIYIPLIGSISSDDGATTYNHGKHRIGNMILHITNGMGTSTMDMRLCSPPQMIVYRLRHEETETNDQTQTENEPNENTDAQTNEPDAQTTQ